MSSKLSMLREKRSNLQKEVELLHKSLEDKKREFEFRNQIQQLGVDGLRNRNGIYNDLSKLTDYESKWKDSFYVKNRLVAEKYGRYTLSEKSIKLAKQLHFNKPFRTDDDYIYVHIIVFCEAVIPTPKGPILKLSDPYGSILTDPLDKATFDEASTWIDCILVADIGFNYKKENHPLKGFRKLKFTLYEEV